MRQKALWSHRLAGNDQEEPRAPWRKGNGVANRADLRGLHVSPENNPNILNILRFYSSLYNKYLVQQPCWI